MKYTYLTITALPFLLAWSASFEGVQERGRLALSLGRFKEAEKIYQQFLNSAAEEEMGIVKTRLAIVYYKDQEHEKAFKIFLEALEEDLRQQQIITQNLSAEEKIVYEQALKIYLDQAGLSPLETAQKITKQFGSIYEKNPEFHHLGYILAVSYANLGNYDQFFDVFYKSYMKVPQHFIAFKAKAALHIKLFERAKTDTEREEQRRLIIGNATKAADLQPNDTSLYRMILDFTTQESKEAIFSAYLNKIIDRNIVIARLDIPYYSEIAITYRQYDLAQKFLNKAREWYAQSRLIIAAQKHLEDSLLDNMKGSYGN